MYNKLVGEMTLAYGYYTFQAKAIRSVLVFRVRNAKLPV